MKISLEALQVLDAIARKGSFAAAAEELHRVPSTLTHTVQRLEEDLGILIFDRSGYRARLTPAGEEILSRARLVLHTARDLEFHAKRIATGWEPELRIVVDALLPCEPLFALVKEFYKEQSGTRLRFSYEVLTGSWDALMSNRADLAIGAPGEGPASPGYKTKLIGELEFLFVVAPDHPLVRAPQPIPSGTLQQYRAVALGDTSISLPPRTEGILSGQDVLTVPHMVAKTLAQTMGLGVGFLPRCMAEQQIRQGILVKLEVENMKPPERFYAAWRAGERGKAMAWWLKRLDKPDLVNGWVTLGPATTDLLPNITQRRDRPVRKQRGRP